MKAGILFFVISDIKDYLVANNMLQNDGTCVFTDIEKDVALAAVIENSLKSHGVSVDDKVDKIIKVLPLALTVFE